MKITVTMVLAIFLSSCLFDVAPTDNTSNNTTPTEQQLMIGHHWCSDWGGASLGWVTNFNDQSHTKYLLNMDSLYVYMIYTPSGFTNKIPYTIDMSIDRMILWDTNNSGMVTNNYYLFTGYFEWFTYDYAGNLLQYRWKPKS